MAPQDSALKTVTVSVLVEWRDGIRTIHSTVVPPDGLTEEIRLDGRVIGFIHRAGRIFVALNGARLDRAVECGQSLLWDKVATQLILESGGFPEVEATPLRSHVRALPHA